MTTTALTEYTNFIVEQFVSGRWRFNPEFKKLSIHELNSAITEAEHRVKYEMRILNSDNQTTFDNLIVFIKANIPYTADEIYMDMFYSGKWFPHTSITSMTTPNLNTFLLDKLIEFQDKKMPYDIDQINRLGLFLKSFVIDGINSQKMT